MTEQRKPGPSLVVSLAVIGLGVVLGAVGVVETLVPFVRTLTQSTSYVTPAHIHSRLSHGTYEVYQLTSRRSSSFSRVEPGRVSITPRDVTVTSPSGTHLSVTYQVTQETLTHGNEVYTGAVKFSVPTAGEYDVTVEADPVSRVILARSLGGLLRTVVGWIVAAAAGGLIAAVGLTMLIVGLVRRRRRPAPYAGFGTLPPADWYADPSEPSQQRYWDGRQWTDQTHQP